MLGDEVAFHELAIGTSLGYIGYGPEGAAELVGPLKFLLAYAQSHGAKTIMLTGRYAAGHGSKLGAGTIDNVNSNFSFSFPATKSGLMGFLKGLGK